MKISQSLIRDLWDVDVCPRFIHFKYIEKRHAEPTDAMLKGLYFEWHLLGAVRSGIEPVFKRLDGGGKSQIEKDMEQAVFRAKNILIRAGIRVDDKAQVQVHLETEATEGHLDLITNDFQKPGKLAIYDTKWTDTKIEDRYNMGWADAENKPEVKLQAVHYIKLYYDLYGVYLPFYYLIFGKSGWVRFIQIRISDEGVIAEHELKMANAVNILTNMGNSGWKAKPEFNKCIACPFYEICDSRALLPRVELITY